MSAAPSTEVTITRLNFGYLIHPAETASVRAPIVFPLLGYLVRHPRGTLLFDTGIGKDPEVDLYYRPHRSSLAGALHDAGARLDDVTIAANCHLHFDHCGGNPDLAARPIFTQAIELENARNTDGYTLPALIDTPEANYQELHGDAEILSGVHLIATPGHTNGHQSLVVEQCDGTVVVGGQLHDGSTNFGYDVLAWDAHRKGHPQPLPAASPWMDKLQAFDPRRVLFAHDHSIWQP